MTDSTGSDRVGDGGQPLLAHDGRLERLAHWAGAATAVVGFLFAIQLLGTATDAAGPVVERLLDRVVVGDASALGLGWLVTYVLTNGSVVAAVAVSLFRSGVVTTSEAFLLVAGSRLGAAAIVVLVGALDYAQKRHGRTLGEGTSLGLLTFLITLSVYVPVTLAGYLLLPVLHPFLEDWSSGVDLSLGSLQFLESVTAMITSVLGPALALLVAVALLFGSLRLFDRVLESVRAAPLREYVFEHFQRRWTSFVVGLVVTSLTTSVAFSLGVVVPLYNRGFVRRREMIPYIMGANLGTLLDTLVVAVVLESPVGVVVVVLLLGLATLLTLALLVVYGPYLAAVETAQDRLLEDRRALLGFGLVLVAVPLALVVVPHVP